MKPPLLSKGNQSERVAEEKRAVPGQTLENLSDLWTEGFPNLQRPGRGIRKWGHLRCHKDQIGAEFRAEGSTGKKKFGPP